MTLFFLSMVVAILDAVYLTYHHYWVNILHPDVSSFCSINSVVDCDGVAASKYSCLIGIPVSSLGLFAYLFVSLYIVGIFLLAKKFFSQLVSLIYPILILMLLFSLYQLYISLFVIEALCIMCMILYASIIVMIFAFKLFLNKSHRLIFKDIYKITLGVDRNLYIRIVLIVAIASLVVSSVTAFAFDKYFRIYFQKLCIEKQKASSNSMPLIYNPDGKLFEEFKLLKLEEIDLNDSPLKGPSEAPVEIVEFSDFQCPACAYKASFIVNLLEKFPGKIKIYFKHLPLDHHCNEKIKREFHPFACQAAKYSYCAYKQGRFWQFHDRIFRERSKINSDFLNNLVKSMNLDHTLFEKCLSSKALAAVKQDIDEANNLNLSYTPTIFLNKKRVSDIIKDLRKIEILIEYILSDHTE